MQPVRPAEQKNEVSARLWAATPLLPPEILEPCRRQLSVTHRVLYRAVAEPILDSPGVVSGVCQCVAAAMAKHVCMYRKIKAGALAKAFYLPIDGVRRERPTALGSKTKPLSGNCRRSSRNALTSSPRSGWTEGLPFLTRRTWRDGDRPNSTCDHSKSQISEARRPCRKATSTSVASRCPHGRPSPP